MWLISQIARQLRPPLAPTNDGYTHLHPQKACARSGLIEFPFTALETQRICRSCLGLPYQHGTCKVG